MSKFWTEEPASELEMVEETLETEELAEGNLPDKEFEEDEGVEYEGEYDEDEGYEEDEEGEVEYDEELIKSIQDNAAFTLTEQDANVMCSARLRLEQARLYEMLINNNIFEGVEGDPKAIQNVQKELKDYIVERLEILLGLRAKKAVAPEPIAVELPFNDIEIDFLKQLSYKGTHGASASGQTTSQVPAKLKPLTTARPKNTLKPLVAKKPVPAVKVEKRVVKKPVKKIVKKNIKKRPLKRKKVRRHIQPKNDTPQKRIRSKSVIPVGLTPDQAEAIARQDMEEMKKRKKWSKMTNKEKVKEITSVNERHARNRPKNAARMPNADELTAKYMTEKAQRDSNGSLNQINSMIADKFVNNQVTQYKGR